MNLHIEHEVVRLKRDVSGVPAGTVGTVVVIAPELPDMNLVEFPDQKGEEIRLVSVHDDDLDSVSEGGTTSRL
jgi:hypothetical protein